jgi:ion channel-forming bestrophin family protein
MIIKRNFNLFKVVQYVRVELTAALCISTSVFILQGENVVQVHLPFSVSAILGSALAIFIAFRNNSSYARWWEARTLWGGIVNSSRILARQIIVNIDNGVITGKVSRETAEEFKRTIVHRQIAFAHSLRIHLRKELNFREFAHLLNAEEFQESVKKKNIPNYLLLQQGQDVKEAIRREILGAFDNISIEPTLASLNNFQGACERIKNTPLLRQYDFFTRVFLYVFMTALPFSLSGDLEKLNLSLMLIPVSIIVTMVFATIAKVGEVNEDPFENRITDVPMTALCNTIERDLKEMIGDENMPEKPEAVNGYLH